MIWTKKDLLQTLAQYKDDDVLVGELWSKLDVSDRLAELKEDYKDYEISLQDVTDFDGEEFWDEYQDEFDKIFDTSISYNYDTMLEDLIAKIQTEREN